MLGKPKQKACFGSGSRNLGASSVSLMWAEIIICTGFTWSWCSNENSNTKSAGRCRIIMKNSNKAFLHTQAWLLDTEKWVFRIRWIKQKVFGLMPEQRKSLWLEISGAKWQKMINGVSAQGCSDVGANGHQKHLRSILDNWRNKRCFFFLLSFLALCKCFAFESCLGSVTLHHNRLLECVRTVSLVAAFTILLPPSSGILSQKPQTSAQHPAPNVCVCLRQSHTHTQNLGLYLCET